MNAKKKEVDYNKLRPDVLERLINERGIICNNTKADIIRKLKLYDEDKYMVETTYEKYEKTKYMVGIDARNWQELTEMGKLVEKGRAKRLFVYAEDRIFYVSEIKLGEN